MVGTVLKISPMCSLYNMVVLPAASSPSMTTCRAHESPHTLSAVTYASSAQLRPVTHPHFLVAEHLVKHLPHSVSHRAESVGADAPRCLGQVVHWTK